MGSGETRSWMQCGLGRASVLFDSPLSATMYAPSSAPRNIASVCPVIEGPVQSKSICDLVEGAFE